MLERIEKYQILEEIGQGGMSVVYRGRDEALDRDVAIKVMHRHLARDPDARKRFSREARAVARLTHRNIPEIYDFSASDDELNYLVTEFVKGAPLSDLLHVEPPSPWPAERLREPARRRCLHALPGGRPRSAKQAACSTGGTAAGLTGDQGRSEPASPTH